MSFDLPEMVNTPFTIMDMTLDDLPKVMCMERVSYSLPWPEVVYRRELSNDRAYFNLVKYQDKIIGYSGVWHMVDEVHVGTIVSHPDFRRRGIGELLLVAIIKRAYLLLAKTVTLEVRPSNRPAQNLYTKYGFEVLGRRKWYYPDTGEDAIIMTTPPLASQQYQALLKSLTGNLFDRLASFNLDESE